MYICDNFGVLKNDKWQTAKDGIFMKHVFHFWNRNEMKNNFFSTTLLKHICVALVFSGRRFKFCLQHLLFRELFNLFDYNIYLLIRFGRICNFSWKIQRKKSIYKIDNSKWNFPNTMCVYRYLHFFHTSSKETLNYQIHLNCNCQKCKTLNIKSYTYKNKNCSKKCKSKNIYMIFRHIKNWP